MGEAKGLVSCSLADLKEVVGSREEVAVYVT